MESYTSVYKSIDVRPPLCPKWSPASSPMPDLAAPAPQQRTAGCSATRPPAALTRMALACYMSSCQHDDIFNSRLGSHLRMGLASKLTADGGWSLQATCKLTLPTQTKQTSAPALTLSEPSPCAGQRPGGP